MYTTRTLRIRRAGSHPLATFSGGLLGNQLD